MKTDIEKISYIDGSNVKEYVNSILLLEKIYKLFLTVLKKELTNSGIEDINHIQGLILYNLGTEQIHITELISRGYYVGSNVSYNLKRLIDLGYVDQSQSPRDKRSSIIKLTQKGLDMFRRVNLILNNQTKKIFRRNGKINPQQFNNMLQKMNFILGDLLKG